MEANIHSISFQHHAAASTYILLFLLLPRTAMVGAQTGPQPNVNPYPYATFSPSMAIITFVLIAALFFMGFFSIYIRRCSDGSFTADSVRRGLSFRARRGSTARGLDPSVIATFPTFSYSEVKDHKIGKGTLECAVCLNEFEEDETLRLLPKCDHVFHPECIDAWLVSHVTCPVCRTNLAPAPQPEEPPADQAFVVTDHGQVNNDNLGRSNSRTRDEVAIQVDQTQEGACNPTSSQTPTRPPRSWSIRRPFSFGKFRSHSTGHSLVQPGENLDRFTLRLPADVRKEVVNRAMLNRSRSCAATLPRQGSARMGYRSGSSRAGRFNRRIGQDRELAAKSDRWVFFSRGLSMKSAKVVVEAGEGSTGKGSGSRTPVRMPSLKCLEPQAADEIEARLFHEDSVRPPV